MIFDEIAKGTLLQEKEISFIRASLAPLEPNFFFVMQPNTKREPFWRRVPSFLQPRKIVTDHFSHQHYPTHYALC